MVVLDFPGQVESFLAGKTGLCSSPAKDVKRLDASACRNVEQGLDNFPNAQSQWVGSYSCRFSFCSMGESCSGLGAPRDTMGESIGEHSSVGVLTLGVAMPGSFETTNEGLCGNGDISITSIAGAGEEDGIGGVVIVSSI